MGFETCGPNEAMVVAGCGYSRPLMVPGGRVWVWPVIQQLQRISLNTMTLQIHSNEVNTSKGVPISCIGVAQVKIQGQNQDMLANACMQFLGKTESQIHQIALETLEGMLESSLLKVIGGCKEGFKVPVSYPNIVLLPGTTVIVPKSAAARHGAITSQM